ncbi:MAG: NAD(P)/FAD-dependent oxidoreductase [Candidatus Aenigmatarchaeota archaeon]
MADYDVVVIGAGPAGSGVAKVCAKAGLSVIVYEKMPAPFAVKRCAEGLMGGFERDYGKVPKKCIAQDISGAVFVAPDNRRFAFKMSGVGGYVLNRKFFDPWLNEVAMKEGAEFHMNTTVSDVIKENGFVKGVKIAGKGGEKEVASNVVVSAEGVESVVARKAGLNTLSLMDNLWSAYQVKMEDIELEDSHKLYFYFGKTVAPRGYLWIFPKGDDSANVGLGIDPRLGMAKDHLMRFIEKTPSLKKGRITEPNTGAIPSGGFLKNMVLDGFAVAGDSAHQVNPIHGGGIIEAYTAGNILGNVIVECAEKGDFSAKSLSKYNELWWEKHGKNLRNAEKIRDIALGLSDEDLGAIFENTSFDDAINVSEGSLKVAVKLLMKNPKLAFLAAKLL